MISGGGPHCLVSALGIGPISARCGTKLSNIPYLRQVQYIMNSAKNT